MYFSNFGANTRFFFVYIYILSTISDLVVFVLVAPCAVCVHPLHACHVSETQWFPLNMLIEIAFKFTEHLCSSTMSNFCRRCFCLLFFFRYSLHSLLDLGENNFHRCAMHLYVLRVAIFRYVCKVKVREKSLLLLDASLL